MMILGMFSLPSSTFVVPRETRLEIRRAISLIHLLSWLSVLRTKRSYRLLKAVFILEFSPGAPAVNGDW